MHENKSDGKYSLNCKQVNQLGMNVIAYDMKIMKKGMMNARHKCLYVGHMMKPGTDAKLLMKGVENVWTN